MKIVILPYLSEKSSDFHEILYTVADFELDGCQVIKNEKVALDRLRVRQNVFLVTYIFFITLCVCCVVVYLLLDVRLLLYYSSTMENVVFRGVA